MSDSPSDHRDPEDVEASTEEASQDAAPTPEVVASTDEREDGPEPGGASPEASDGKASDETTSSGEGADPGQDADEQATEEGAVATADEPTPESSEATEVLAKASSGSEAEDETQGEVKSEEASGADASDASAEDAEPPTPVATEGVETATEGDEGSAGDDEATDEAPAEAAATGSEAESADAAPKKKRKKKPKKAKKPAPPAEESEAVKALRQAREDKTPVEGRIFGWNDGGFHVVIGDTPAFCPRSEITASQSVGDPDSYVDQTLPFRVLKVQSRGRRIVVSHAVLEREERQEKRTATLETLEVGTTATGTVSSLTDFGAFVDLGGIEGLVHVSEISRQRVENPADALELGQQVEVKVLKIEKGGKRISLSMKALEPDPWREVKEKYEEGSVVTGRVERTARPGAFIELEPGLTGLLPTSEMALPRDAIPGRLYPPGREVKVQIVQVDSRRRRISLAPEGKALGGSRADYMKYQKEQKSGGDGFNALASALSKLKK